MRTHAAIVLSVGLVAAGRTANEDPWARAARLVALMTEDEKFGFLQQNLTGPCSTSGYTGCLAAVPRLGIPEMRMNDGPEGFRGPPGKSTQWPSGLTVAHSWDRALFKEYGTAMGAEFAGKGGNVMFGPGLNVQRVANGGRSFEYSSGEDPFLGAELAQGEVAGIQSQGVIATAKHFIDNDQEGYIHGAGDRHTTSAFVDERTQMELYWPPFEGAIKAGVLSVMCANNMVNGVYVCENNRTGNWLLREHGGFKGWMCSDYDATRSTIDAANHGLDIAMPGPPRRPDYFARPLRAAVANGDVSQATIDEKVTRVVYSLAAVGALDTPKTGTADTDVTSDAHRALARRLAAASATLLRNEGGALPLNLAALKKRPAGSVALIGAAAGNGAIFGGGGSGKVVPKHAVSVLEALRSRFAQSADANRGPPGPLVYTNGADVAAATKLARESELVIMVLAQQSHEDKDRTSLALSDDALVSAVTAVNANTVVVAVSPGPFLTKWRGGAAAIVDFGMAGEQEGHAVADVLFGDVNPRGKLPHTLPNRWNETAFSVRQYPGVAPAPGKGEVACSVTPTAPTADGHNPSGGTGAAPCRPYEAHYDEGLLTGYRWYDAHAVEPAYAFGHGLSYTTFGYADLTVSTRGVTFTVTNTGRVAGAEVAQLYLGFPPAAGEPPQLLKGFEVVTLAAGAKASVTIPLNTRSFSTWDVETHAWAVAHGEFSVLIGASSRDIRLRGRVSV
eukprot:TRINITY_DN30158_c0_g1_i1.p1 TRINITY_DN30158_c0_g1~~TRINITY_DN30158_c0_g1_i1.p1  ORF type:complete len:732 (+),score=179.57 TRINITY_DN30158_c0_g1_i1:65-2260(+)